MCDWLEPMGKDCRTADIIHSVTDFEISKFVCYLSEGIKWSSGTEIDALSGSV
jgi:hypothetical protein